MDGVMFVSDDEWAWGWRNEAGRLFQRLGDAYRKERFVILREEDDGGTPLTHRPIARSAVNSIISIVVCVCVCVAFEQYKQSIAFREWSGVFLFRLLKLYRPTLG